MKQATLKIDESRQEVYVNGKDVNLSRKELQLLVALKDSKVTLSRDALIDLAWDASYKFVIGTRTVDQHIARIRRKLGVPGIIKTVSGYGYKIGVPYMRSS